MKNEDKLPIRKERKYKLIGEDGTELGEYIAGKVVDNVERRKNRPESRRVPSRTPRRILFRDFRDDGE